MNLESERRMTPEELRRNNQHNSLIAGKVESQAVVSVQNWQALVSMMKDSAQVTEQLLGVLQQLATQETMAEMLNDQLNYIESEMRRQTENGEQFLNRLSRENENLQSELRQQAGKLSESNSTWHATTEAWLGRMRLQWILFLLPWVLNTILLFLLWLSLR